MVLLLVSSDCSAYPAHPAQVNADSQACLGLEGVLLHLLQVQYKRVKPASQPYLCLQSLLALLSIVHVQVAH